MIRYAYTSDFKTFTAPQTYIDESPTATIDMNLLPYPGSTSKFLRFLKDETLRRVYVEYSSAGLFGTWSRIGGETGFIRAEVEGPAAYWDNKVDGTVHLLVDDYGGVGYIPLVSSDPLRNEWTLSSTDDFPSGLRHGSILPVNQAQMDALSAAWQV